MVCDGMHIMVYGCIKISANACMHVSHVCMYVRTRVYCIGLLYWSIVLVYCIGI